MGFAEDFSQCLADAGIPIDSSAIPERADLELGLNALTEWVDSLEDPTREALDEVTGEFSVQVGIAEVDIAPTLRSLLEAIDGIDNVVPISTLMETSTTCLQQV
jgi:hypothetical protein